MSLLIDWGYVSHNGGLRVIVKILVIKNASNRWKDVSRQDLLRCYFWISERFFLRYLEHAILVDWSDFLAFFITHY